MGSYHLITARQSAALAMLSLCPLLASGCRTGAPIPEDPGGILQGRERAERLVLGEVFKGTLPPGERVRFYWRYIYAAGPGTLEAELGWQGRENKLELSIYDPEGVSLRQVTGDGARGSRARVDVRQVGRYYLRVRGDPAAGAARFTLRARFAPGSCDDCTAGERMCYDEGPTYLCVQLRPGCTSWLRDGPCAEGSPCEGGTCEPADFEIGRIISLYMTRGLAVVHIELGEASRVRPGHRGVVLRGRTDTPRPGGGIEVLRVMGRYCTARYPGNRLGGDRHVKIWIR